MNTPHIPVLLAQTMALLDPQKGESYLDATAGYGGHAAEVIRAVGDEASVVLVDRDHQAVQALRKRFGQRVRIIHKDFAAAAEELLAEGAGFDLILLDLGVSSPQLDVAERGFSFRESANLDMRMDQSQDLTAADVVNTWKEAALADIIYRYGEERRSRAIARAIVAARPITTTTQLREVVARAVRRPGVYSAIDPATKTFQAIRIAVNDELGQVEASLPCLTALLNPGGRLAVISFHSLEDRLVKQYFDRESKDCICPPEQPICICNHHASLQKITKKPVAGLTDALNPRARSAKLRVVRKLKQTQKEVL